MGDKVIRMTGSTILEVMEIDEVDRWSFPERVLRSNGSFAGRLGGDEYIVISRFRGIEMPDGRLGCGR